MLEAVGAEGVAKTAQSLGNPRAKASCFLAYKAEKMGFVAWGETEGTLILPGRGSGGFGWDPVFLPDGETRTFAELTAPQKIALGHRGRAWRRFLDFLPDLE